MAGASEHNHGVDEHDGITFKIDHKSLPHRCCRKWNADVRRLSRLNALSQQSSSRILVTISVISLTAYGGLFLVAFGAATILPFQSEPVLVGLLASGRFSVPGLITVASVGNVLGAVCNWVLGRFIDRFQDRAWFPVKKPSLERASGWYRRYGRWSLLLCWMPVFGDALTVIAGVLREPLWSFVVLVTLAKIGR